MTTYLEESLEPGLRVQYKLERTLGSATTEFQVVSLVDIEPFGRSLVIDGLIQSCRVDEFVYHECLVHPAMLMHPNPKTVFIGGGGEGSTAREVLKHKSVERCVMVDIDGEVVRFCREHLEENSAAFADKRLELVIEDAQAWLKRCDTKFDVIIMDLDDPLEGGPCYQLYTTEFYNFLKSKMNPGGVFVTQSGPCGIKSHPLVCSPINRTLREVFGTVVPYNQAVYSFMDEWGWNLAFAQEGQRLPTSLSAEEVDRLIASRIEGELKFLDGISWTGVWQLSKMHRSTLAKETKVMSNTGSQHSFMHNAGVKTVAEANKKAGEGGEPQDEKQRV